MPDAADRLATDLQGAFGPQRALSDATARAPYERDWRGRTAAACVAVLLPRSVAEVQDMVRWCQQRGVAIVPQGGNTGLCGGSVPHPGTQRPQVILAPGRLQTVRAIDPDNDAITVEAGCTLQSVQELAARYDRLFPLSLASEGSCQVGGALSTNAGGVQVLRYGNMRALTLGLEVVLPDGALWSSLRGLRKDNTGYDLKQLFIGAEGTLGIITAATLRLYPLPQRQTVAWIAVADVRRALDLFHALRHQIGDRLSAFELIGRLPLDLAIRHLPGARDPLAAVHPWQLLVQVDGVDAGELGEHLAAVLERAPDLVNDAVIAHSQTQAQALWRLRENLSEAQRLEGPSLKHDISLPQSHIAPFIEQARTALEASEPGVAIVCFGHLGDGNLHYNLFPAQRDSTTADIAQRHAGLTRIVHDLVAAHGGSFSAEHGIGQFKVDELERYGDPVGLQLMRRLKQAWDPDHLFNPGKLFSQ